MSIAPELSLYATQARPTIFTLGLRQSFGEAATLLLRARRERAGPFGDSTALFAPSGHRTLWSVSLALLLAS